MKAQFLIAALLVATIYTQSAVAKKPAVKGKVSIKAPKIKVHAKVTKPSIKAKIPKIKVKIGTKAKAGAKVHIKIAAPKLILTGSCPAAKFFKSLVVLKKPVVYKTQTMCKNLKTGCCSEKSLTAFKTNWNQWVKQKSAFFWTLSKWPQGLASILRHQKAGLTCRLPGSNLKLKVKIPKTNRVLQAASKKRLQSVNVHVPKFGLKMKTGMKNFAKGAKMFAKGAKKVGLKMKAGAKKFAKGAKKVGLKMKAGAKKMGNMMKAGLKLKPKLSLKLKIKAKKHRRLQVAASKVNLSDAKFTANVPQPTTLAGDGQSAPSKSWMMFAGMMTFVALIFN